MTPGASLVNLCKWFPDQTCIYVYICVIRKHSSMWNLMNINYMNLRLYLPILLQMSQIFIWNKCMLGFSSMITYIIWFISMYLTIYVQYLSFIGKNFWKIWPLIMETHWERWEVLRSIAIMELNLCHSIPEFRETVYLTF